MPEKPPIKLIEISLPLDVINEESAREKSIRHGHPSTLHLWWSRKPLAAVRAVLWSSLVDDPSAHPDIFPTEAEQARERARLHRLLTDLVKWENTGNEEILEAARAEIVKSMGNEKLALLDPFAGGGTIPLEAQRLGLSAHAHDLNPVAVMINKAMIEIPPKFADMAPVNPQARQGLADQSWPGATGLAEDVRHYGAWLKNEAFRRIGHLYPKAKLPDDTDATVIAWLWARTVKCPNPACGCEMPLTSSFVLSKKKGREAWVEPLIEEGRLSFHVHSGPCPQGHESNKLAKGASFKCPSCGAVTEKSYIHDAFMAGESGATLMAIVAEGDKGRVYLSPSNEHVATAHDLSNHQLINFPDGDLVGKAKSDVGAYGMSHFSELFTPRQLTALATFSELIDEARARTEADAILAGLPDDGVGLADGGRGAKAYGEAVAVYLAFVVDKQANYSSKHNVWADGFIAQTFGRQALPMIWNFAETNIFGNTSGCFSNMLDWLIKSVKELPATSSGIALQKAAQDGASMGNLVISTDPPYYDNICYADISDYFYIWMRQALKNIFPDIFKTMQVPKAEELVVTPWRFNGNKQRSREFFENGMFEAFKKVHENAREDVPVTIYYAYKQTENDAKDDKVGISTGWETMLSGLIKAGFLIVGTWPLHTERETGLKNNLNALASSIVLVCRKRSPDAPAATRRQFLAELKDALPPAMRQLQAASIAPVDLAQAAIGPGMAVFSKYSRVLEADGSPMGTRQALQAINAELDAILIAGEGALDQASRFCVALYSQHGFNKMRFGDADVLARAKNTSTDRLASLGLLESGQGYVRLIERDELPKKPPEGLENCLWLFAQYLARALTIGGGVSEAARLAALHPESAARAKDLAYRLFTTAEKRGWNGEAFAWNAIAASWPEIELAAAHLKGSHWEFTRLPEKE